ncbi:hypothetical protein C922_00825 [Plasmodium inui San Antonio 1]|uniref:Uncharacterized protein n=1 Tax=Plasmodium inui San Antonio 1 TaxID=1237626 RepID=W7ACV1_9APIC|nr:hypothetical protein C922_00825 [Plasmodium inui San Antonio 1]EUD69133.1 hypothetical protein C922_00825 [Plasmodium inui San Antonio 1]
MIRRGRNVATAISPLFSTSRKVQTSVGRTPGKKHSPDHYDGLSYRHHGLSCLNDDWSYHQDDLSFLNDDIKHNLFRLKCIEQKKIKTDRIVYKKILKDLLKKKDSFVASDMVEFFYILIFNDLYHLDICSNFFLHFYQRCVYSRRYLEGVHVNSVVHLIFAFYVFEGYGFFSGAANRGVPNLGGVTPGVNSGANSGASSGASSGATSEANTDASTKRYREYHRNEAHMSFHLYTHLAPYIHTNKEHINKSHLIKMLLVLSQFTSNWAATALMPTADTEAAEQRSAMKHVGINLFPLIESFAEKIDIAKDIKKVYSPEVINEKEMKKKKGRYLHMIDNSSKNFIYIDNESNDNKLICLFFFILSKLFFPVCSNFLLHTEGTVEGSPPTGEQSPKQPSQEETLMCEKKSGDSTMEEDTLFCTDGKTTHRSCEKLKFTLVDMFMSHYRQVEMRNHVFYRNVDTQRSGVENYETYKNNILRAMRKYVFLDDIYSLGVYYKMVFFKAIYSLHFFQFSFLRHLYEIHSYAISSDVDHLDYSERLHFSGEYSDEVDGEMAELDRERAKPRHPEKTCAQKHPQKRCDERAKNKIVELAKRGDVFNNAYVNLLNNIESDIRNCSPEEALNTLLQLHLLRSLDNHFVLPLISKLCNSTDKLRNEHKKKMNVIILSLLSFLSPHIASIESIQKGPLRDVNVFNHAYCNNDVYVGHLQRLRDFVQLLHNKQIFKRKRKELLSWSNYKCV